MPLTISPAVDAIEDARQHSSARICARCGQPIPSEYEVCPRCQSPFG
jgi:predicted amidophosphoribosyltransferase